MLTMNTEALKHYNFKEEYKIFTDQAVGQGQVSSLWNSWLTKTILKKINIISYVHYCFIQHILRTRNWSYLMATNNSLLHLTNKNRCQKKHTKQQL